MGNSCKRHKKDESAKQHFSSIKNSNFDEEDDNKSNASNNIKNEEVKNVPKNIENKKEEKEEKEEKVSKKKIVVKEEKENKSNDVDNFSEVEPTCNLKLEISLKKVPSQREYKIEIYEYKNSRKIEKKKIAETESKAASPDKNIDFEKDIIIPLHFSQKQPLEFVINDQNIDNTMISKTLGEIVGSLRQTYRETFDSGMIFEVKAILNDELNKTCVFNIQVSGNFLGMKIGYFITSLGNQYDPINKLVYESEIKGNNNLINFNESAIPLSELASDENLEDNIVEIGFKDVAHSNEIGKYKSSINQLFVKDIDFSLTGNKKAKIVCRRKHFHSLLDYLERDLHLATTLYIDFSENSEANAHHIIKNESIFENLMRSFLEILEPYNEDQFFHIYGYGFKLKEKLKVEYDPYMFPINQKIEYPATPMKEINKFYNDFLKSIDFDNAKTNLHLIIQKFNNRIKADIDNYDIREYNILLIFTNNDITDEKEFVKNIIFSSTLPISIVIVGLGKGPFSKLENIESNFLNLKDDEGNKPQRKCIKFVSFNKNQKNSQSTVKNSLINIPDEMVEYLGIKNIVPSI